MLEDRLHNFDDIVFSCFLPDDWLNEFRYAATRTSCMFMLVFYFDGLMLFAL